MPSGRQMAARIAGTVAQIGPEPFHATWHVSSGATSASRANPGRQHFPLTLPLVFRPGSEPRVNPMTRRHALSPGEHCWTTQHPYVRHRPGNPALGKTIVGGRSEHLKADSRLILIVEDDLSFATICVTWT